MEAVVMYFFLAIVQMHGGTGAAYGTLAECEAEQTKMAQSQTTLAISPCVEIKLAEPKR